MTTDLDYLRLAAQLCEMSHDISTTNAAVLVPADEFWQPVMAPNVFPRGVAHRHDRPEKYAYIEHAERAVIYQAARRGVRTAGATMYCPWFACQDCARAIAMCGIKQVVGSLRARAATPERWLKAVETGESILRESGVGIRWINEKLGVSIRFNEGVIDL